MNNKSLDQPDNAIDEALWAAYRCDDKAAVMDYLFCQNLVGIGCSGSLPQPMITSRSKKSFDSRRANGGQVLINGGRRQTSLRSTVN
jgi:hypothetical protein